MNDGKRKRNLRLFAWGIVLAALVAWTPGAAQEADENENDAPVAAFTFGPDEPTTAHKVRFTDQSSDSDGTVVRWLWQTSAHPRGTPAQSPNIRFPQVGSVAVTLTVWDDDGASAEVTKTFEVLASPRPKIDFEFSPDIITTNTIVRFKDTSVMHGDVTVNLWDWRLTDLQGTRYGGRDEKNRFQVHLFNQPGQYRVGLFITDSDDVTWSREKTVNVTSADLASQMQAQNETLPVPAGTLVPVAALAAAAWAARRRVKDS